VLVVPVVVLTLLRWRRRQVPAIQAALAASLPLYILVLAFSYRHNPWIGRFMLIPAALVAPLLGTVLKTPRYATVVLAVALATLASTVLFNHAKPSGIGRPASVWHMTRTEAQSVQRPAMRRVLATLEACVPPDARIGYVLDRDDWDYPLYGRSLARTLVSLTDEPARQQLSSAELRGLNWALVRHRLVAAFPPGWTSLRFRGSGLDLLARTRNLAARGSGCRPAA
jgi:hypothetical protein